MEKQFLTSYYFMVLSYCTLCILKKRPNVLSSKNRYARREVPTDDRQGRAKRTSPVDGMDEGSA